MRLRQVLFVWSCAFYSSKFSMSAQRPALQFWTRTSAVGLHGLSPTRASVPQAGGHILARLALCRLGRLWLCLRTQEAQGKGVNTFADMYIIRLDHLVIHPSVTSSALLYACQTSCRGRHTLKIVQSSIRTRVFGACMSFS